MLTTLCITQPRKRRLSFRRRPPTVYSEFVTVGSGRYIKINAESGRDGSPDWEQVRRAAGREAGRMLLPRGCMPPEGSRIAPFGGRELARQLMTVTGVTLLEMVALNPRLVQVSVYDPRAVMPDLPLLFMPYAADVRVVTGRPERFERQQYEAMKKYGAVLSVRNETESLNGSFLILAPEGVPDARKLSASPRGLLLSAVPVPETVKNDSWYQNKIVDGYMPRVPGSFYTALPSGCDAGEFLAGLYELSGIREIASKPPEFLYVGGHTIPLKDAAWKLAGIDIGMSV